MKRRFIVAVDSSTKEQNEAFRDCVVEWGVAWWHWLDNAWLICDREGVLTADEIRDALYTTHVHESCLVVQLDENGGETWSGYGPKGEGRNMFNWLRRTWAEFQRNPGEPGLFDS